MSMRIFGILSPNSDRVTSYQKAATFGELQEKLLIGYKIVNEVLDGITVPPLPDGLKRYTYMTHLLHVHGEELREWLAGNGCVCRCMTSPVTGGADSGDSSIGEII